MIIKNINEYNDLLKSIKDKVLSSSYKAFRSVNKELTNLYWFIGRNIVRKQEKIGWGKAVVDKLASDLKAKLPNTYGFSAQNLWYMRQFYIEYKDYPNLQQLVGEIPWGQNLLIISKVKNMQAKEFYIKSTIQMGWSRNVLLNQIKSQLYEQKMVTKKQHNFNKALPEHLAEQANTTMKDSYMLDFLGISKPILEKELEARMVEKIKYVLLEFGYGFSFIGNQYKISTKNKDYFLDLLFFHRKLKCLVAIELKIGSYKPEYAGKMNFYLNLLDEYIKEKEENPSIGIILCADKDHLDVEFSLKGINKPVGVSEYQLIKKLPKNMQKNLPSTDELEKELLKEFH